VENVEVIDVLRNLGCDLAQGYAISQPLPADKLAEWLETCTWTTKSTRRTVIKVADRLRAV
jgi:EAL domain-containing protein (putative c-di-GMP-specific phosphodiesterase class I)